ncbi:MAG: hypothetical protein ACTS3F_07820 [Phycisphaerales bacterium]
MAWRTSGPLGSPREYLEHTHIGDARRLVHHGSGGGAIGVSEVTVFGDPSILVHPDDYDGLFYDLKPDQLASSVHPSAIPHWARRTTPPTPDCLQLQWITTRASGFPFRMYAVMDARYTIAGVDGRPPSWDCINNHDLMMRITSRSVELDGTGSLAIETTWGSIDLSRIQKAVHRATRSHITLPNRLPLTPIWPGLLANTAIYTAAIWAFCWALAAVRRRIHRWRHPNANPCKNCRYDLTGLDTDHCPECGQAILRASPSEASDHAP